MLISELLTRWLRAHHCINGVCPTVVTYLFTRRNNHCKPTDSLLHPHVSQNLYGNSICLYPQEGLTLD